MLVRIVAAIVAVALVLAYLGTIALKMKDAALFCVIALGIVAMLVDLLHSLRRRED